MAVSSAAFGTDAPPVQFFDKNLAALAHPSSLTSGHAKHKCMSGHIGSDHGTSSDHCPLPYLVPANDRGIGTDGSTRANGSMQIASFSLWVLCTRRQIVGEHARRTAEHPILEFDTFVHRNVVLNLHPVADANVVCDVDVLAQAAVLPDLGTSLNMAEVPYLGPIANHRPVIDNRSRMYLNCHSRIPQPYQAWRRLQEGA